MAIKRRAHYLKTNARSESPSNLLIVDTEAQIEKLSNGSQRQTFRLGHAIHIMKKDDGWVSTPYELWSVDDFWELLDRVAYSKKRLYVIAHNMAYDYTILKMDTYISSRELKLTMRMIASVFIIKAANIMFISSTNFYKQKLADLGKIFGLSKMETPDFEDCTDDELMPYCIRDTEVMAHVMKAHIDFIKDNDLGCFKPTVAGQALQTYRHGFMHHKLLVHAYDEILSLESESYRGGRCEAFRMGTFEDITYLDINSMYPYVMKSFEYPTIVASHDIMTDIDTDGLKAALDAGYFVLAECDLEMYMPAIGVKQDGKLIFPTGHLRRVITSPEIEYLLREPDIGRILHVQRMVLYHKASIFSEYVDYFYQFRMTTTNEAYKQMTKILLNSLYGKMAQRSSTDTKQVTDKATVDLYFQMMLDARTFEIFGEDGSKHVRVGDNLFLITKQEGEFSRDSMPIISSAVTSYARMLLYTLICEAWPENVVYTDTDSLFVTREGLERLQGWLSEKELGKLKVEKSGTVEIRGAKDYTFNGVLKLKGVKKNAEDLGNGCYRQLSFETKHVRYRKATPDGVVMVVPVVKHITRNYDKGIIVGSYVKPFVLNECE